MLADALYSAGTGAVFGAALTASRVYLPSVIINQFLFADFHMLHVFCVAMGSSAAIMLALDKFGSIPRPVRSNSSLHRFSAYDGNILGGMMVGVGMALSGACPGTVIVQLAQGISTAGSTLFGAVLGAGAYVRLIGRIKKQVPPHSEEENAPGTKQTISEVSQIPDAALYPIFGAAIVGVLYLTSPAPVNSPTTPVVGGLLIGLAQAASLLLTSSPLGTSAAYEQLSRYIMRMAGLRDVAKPIWPPRSIVFVLGILAGSIILVHSGYPVGDVRTSLDVSDWQALVGGFSMAFGARLAGGCTSGHGLSGLGAMSFSSMITVVSMFGAGIASRQLMRLP